MLGPTWSHRAAWACWVVLLMWRVSFIKGEGSQMTCEEADGLARDLMYEGRLDEAREAYLQLIEVCPPDAGRHNDLGQVYWQSGQFDEAVGAFKKAVDLDPSNAFIVHNLGALLHFQGTDMIAAEIALEKAIQLAKEEGHDTLRNHAERTLHRCKQHQKHVVQREKLLTMHEEARVSSDSEAGARDGQCDWKQKADKLLDGADLSIVAAKYGSVVKVEEREAAELTYEEFMREYALKRKPVVIKGITKAITKSGVPWDLDYIQVPLAPSQGGTMIDGVVRGQKKCGDKVIITRVFNRDSTKWAGLEDYDSPILADFLTRYKKGTTEEYLFDWSLPKACPELLEDFVVPKYFSADYLQEFPAQNLHPQTHVDDPPRLFADSWPSLFVGPEKSGGGLHVDAFGSNFWMAVFSGYKLWQFFSEADLPYLYPSHRDDTFGVNTRDPDYVAAPLYAFANASACILGPGDGLFVPAGSPHQVTNLSPSVAISMNYVDSSNIDRAVSVTAVEGLVDENQAWIHSQLAALQTSDRLSGDQSSPDRPWENFKRRS